MLGSSTSKNAYLQGWSLPIILISPSDRRWKFGQPDFVSDSPFSINVFNLCKRNLTMNILLTGASGFIGRYFANQLALDGHCLKLLGGRNTPPIPETNPMEGKAHEAFATGPLEQAKDLDQLMVGIDMVVHAAGLAHITDSSGRQDADAFRKANVDATAAICEAAAQVGVKRFVLLSSIASKLLENEYGRSKLEGERITNQILSGQLETVILRPPMVYGPGAPGNLHRLLWLIEKRIPLPFGSMPGKRSLCSIANLGDAVANIIAARSAESAIYEICDDEQVTLATIAKTLAKGLGVRAFVVPIPSKLVSSTLSIVAPGMSKHLFESLVLNPQPLKQAFDWSPRQTTHLGLELVGQYRRRSR